VAVDPARNDLTAAILRAAAGHDFALAGGYALNVRGIVDRPTEDLDVFTNRAHAPADALPAITAALRDAGYTVEITRPPAPDGDFARFTATRDGNAVIVDLARDWRAYPATPVPDLGPVLTSEDLIASKTAALVARALPRDFVDIAAALTTHTREQLLHAAFTRDPGLRVEDFTTAAAVLDTLDEASSPGTASPPPTSPPSAQPSPPGPATPPTTSPGTPFTPPHTAPPRAAT